MDNHRLIKMLQEAWEQIGQLKMQPSKDEIEQVKLRTQAREQHLLDEIKKLSDQNKKLSDQNKKLSTDSTPSTPNIPATGTLPMHRKADRMYIEGVAYQIRTLGYKREYPDDVLPVATLKVFRDDKHADKYLRAAGADHRTGEARKRRGAPVRLGAVIVECEEPLMPEKLCGRNQKGG